jgi:hypothetical protein
MTDPATKSGPQWYSEEGSTPSNRPDADRRPPLARSYTGAGSQAAHCGATGEPEADVGGNQDTVARASAPVGGETPGAINSNCRAAMRAPGDGLRSGGSRSEGLAPCHVTPPSDLPPVAERRRGSFPCSEVLVRRGATIESIARACLGDLVCVTMPGGSDALEIIAIAGAFGAALQARGVCAVSPLALAARHRFSALEARADVPTPGVACAAGWGRQIHSRSDALVVLCRHGWDDDQRVAVEMAEALTANRRVFLVQHA